MGRNNELAYLNQLYATSASQLIILYGQKNIGKTTLIMDFLKGKDNLYYLAGEASMRQQQYLMARQWRNRGLEVSQYPEYSELMQAFAKGSGDKKVLVIDEFDHLIKNDSDFMEQAAALVSGSYSSQQVLVILMSSSVGFIENQLVSRIGKSALSISGFLKIRELKFEDVSYHFPDYSLEDRIAVYSILGGIPGLWRHFDPMITLKQNICKNILSQDAFLFEEGSRYVREAVRECGVYYSILSALAEGMDKLGDIYQHTGFSRAKISVYLKNLMELEIARKVFSVDTRGRDMLRKGIYRISNHYVAFWFRFLYPYYSMTATLSSESYFETYVQHELTDFCKPYFSEICREYMEKLARSNAFGFEVYESGIFDGKEGFIDYLGFDEEQDRCVAAFSCYDKPYMTYEFYQRALKSLADAKASPEMIFLFARDGFDEKVTLEAKVRNNIRLLRMEDFLV
ncbi:MAG: ATP-binding protein [Lachnospiraceae bacterium]|nr:ATP-binding protein [Lachnospiraceae bacterium]